MIFIALYWGRLILIGEATALFHIKAVEGVTRGYPAAAVSANVATFGAEVAKL